MILWRMWATRCLEGGEQDFMLDWTPLRSIPQVVPRPRVAENGARQKKTQ